MNFRLLAALLAASEATFELENTPYGDRIENRWNLLRRWVRENLHGHTSATKTAENQNPKAFRKIDRGERYMMDYYKRKLAKHTEYETYARCSGHEQVESSVPEVTDEVGTSQYALLKMNKVIADVFNDECNFNAAKSERRRAQYENLLMNVFTRWARQCNRINPFSCDTEHCVQKQVGWGELKCRRRTEDDARFGDAGFGAEGTKYADKWWMNYD